jgi:hypothetical protein
MGEGAFLALDFSPDDRWIAFSIERIRPAGSYKGKANA